MNPFPVRAKCAWKFAGALASVAIILVAAGCGSGGGTIGPPVSGNFSNASLNGQYAFTLHGFGFIVGSTTAADYFVEGGVFTADGNGNITAGTDDFFQNNLPFSDPVTGTYRINKDGSGDIQFNFPSGGASVYHITLSDSSHFYMAEEDGIGTSAGSGEKQDPSQLSTMPSGTFVVRAHDLAVSATMARMTISGGTVSGSFFELQNGSQSTGAVTGLAGVPTNGRGTLTYAVGSENHTVLYYIVNANKFRILDVTPPFLSIGQAEMQSAITFSNASLMSSYAFGSSGETTNVDGIHTVGVFTSDGSGHITTGNFDSVQDGAVSSNVPIASGSYAINADGSGTLLLGSEQHQVWMVSPTRAFFIAINGINLEDGTFDQQVGTFGTGSLNIQSAFFMDGFDTVFKDRVGTLVPNGTGGLGTNYTSSFFDPNALTGGNSPNSFTGSYSVSSNGRVTSQLNGFTNGLVFYLISNNNGYILQADPGVGIGGAFTQQTGP